MIRRVPTAIELKFEDIREYEALRKEMNCKTKTAINEESSSSDTPIEYDVDEATVEALKQRLRAICGVD